jgi:hypothetical protein
MGFRRMGGELIIHYVHWNGTLDIIRVPAGVQRIVQIPALGFFSMTVRVDRRSPVGGESVGRPAPTQKFRRAVRGGGSVGRPYTGRDRPRTEGRVGRSGTQIKKSTSHPLEIRNIIGRHIISDHHPFIVISFQICWNLTPSRPYLSTLK